jgi:hypothetical protein
LAQLRAACANAISSYRNSTGSQRAAALLLIVTLQDKIGAVVRRRLGPGAIPHDPLAWVDRWQPADDDNPPNG